jgi:hypothetical protein
VPSGPSRELRGSPDDPKQRGEPTHRAWR